MFQSNDKTTNNSIDIIVLWVDGNDPAWLEEKSITLNTPSIKTDNIRYRDWNLMKYWFRGIEKYAPWINKIHFVTWGHIPKWLKTDHPKLNIVKHADYMPKESLPTYNSSALLINLHRIKGLSNRFIIFNDDTFLINNVTPDQFFKKGLPRSIAGHCPYRLETTDPFYPPLNNVAIINDNFNMKRSIVKNIFKWLNPLNGANAISTLLMLPFPAFYGFANSHLPEPYLKKTFIETWKYAEDALAKTTLNKTRTPHDVNEWLMRYWQLASGSFYPQKRNIGYAFLPGRFISGIDYAESVSKFILSQRNPMICINDGNFTEIEFEKTKTLIEKSFNRILPDPSSFEK